MTTGKKWEIECCDCGCSHCGGGKQTMTSGYGNSEHQGSYVLKAQQEWKGEQIMRTEYGSDGDVEIELEDFEL